MKHRGEIVNDAIRKSGMNISTLCKKLDVSRTTFYRWIEEPNLSLDVILKIGDVIKHDFSEDLKEIPNFVAEEHAERYKTVTKEQTKVSVTVDLDGTDETIDKWLRLLPELLRPLKYLHHSPPA